MNAPIDIDAKAHEELLVVLAACGVAYSDLTQFERLLWSQAFRRGVVHGLEITKAEIRQMGVA